MLSRNGKEFTANGATNVRAGTEWVKLVSSGDILGSGPGKGPSGGATLQVSR